MVKKRIGREKGERKGPQSADLFAIIVTHSSVACSKSFLLFGLLGCLIL